jgi:TRAP-type mannitol/chloroaromatic compound transport system permease large subunit
MTDSLLGPLMFLGLLVFVFSGYPIAFSLAGTGLFFFYLWYVNGIF